MKSYDIIIIGAGINGLITASILGKKGKSVLLLESRDKIGGMASTMEFAPGFKCNAINDTIKWIDPRVIKFLDLYNNGLEIIQPDILKTIIGDGASIGSNTALVAPVKIGAKAIIGAGSTITADVPNDAIATTRSALDVRHGAAVRYRKIRNEQS